MPHKAFITNTQTQGLLKIRLKELCFKKRRLAQKSKQARIYDRKESYEG
jgi:hypothetical protein